MHLLTVSPFEHQLLPAVKMPEPGLSWSHAGRAASEREFNQHHAVYQTPYRALLPVRRFKSFLFNNDGLIRH
jgi:hypothetical protein